MKFCFIADHTYSRWNIFESRHYQVDRLEIHHWCKAAHKPPVLVRGYRIVDLNKNEYRYIHCQEADNFISTSLSRSKLFT